MDDKTIADDMQRLMQHAETYQPPKETEPGQTKMTADDKQTALAFLKNPAMFDEILEDFETIGYTGEAMNSCCVISRRSRARWTSLCR